MIHFKGHLRDVDIFCTIWNTSRNSRINIFLQAIFWHNLFDVLSELAVHRFVWIISGYRIAQVS
ncbi:hypothetical protein HISP_14365 [Haloarcula hispanica N601]|uniref:Uncharacterized protein n=1 Tax=Haloarcula hispanica N601 TaxID=1417673 RepID=V5TR10_HALHI|nr:hypothetical protein HISP_14365 [Haloarcula hispanica N601]